MDSLKQDRSPLKELFLLRGLPQLGAGKSTLAKSLNEVYFEADQYFIEFHEYKFDASKLKLAHGWCQLRTEHAMEDESPRIVVSNTFTQEWEMKEYYELAEKYGYRVYSLIVENRHDGINEHNVPANKIEQMRNRFEVKL